MPDWESQFLDQKAGILDDAIVTKLAEDKLFVVSNAGTCYRDLEQLRSEAWEGLQISFQSESHSLVALQGPKAVQALLPVLDKDEDRAAIRTLPFMTAKHASIAGATCLVSRLGYTGEDGVEVLHHLLSPFPPT